MAVTANTANDQGPKTKDLRSRTWPKTWHLTP